MESHEGAEPHVDEPRWYRRLVPSSGFISLAALVDLERGKDSLREERFYDF